VNDAEVSQPTSHLTTLVNRFLAALERLKTQHQLNQLAGEPELRRHLANIIEYTFYVHKPQVTEPEVETLTHLLERG
jgi:hypothetical protein